MVAFIDEAVAELLPWLKHAGAYLLSVLPKVLLAVLVLFIGLKLVGCFEGWLQATLEAVNIKRSKRSRSYSIRSLFSGSSTQDQDGDDGVDEEVDAEPQASHRVNPTLMKFALSVASKGLKALLLITVASMVGISTTSLVAVITMSSLAIGLALQGLLKDLAAGVMMLIFQAVQAGDLVELAGEFGKVVEIGMFETVLHTLDNKTVTIPNSEIKTITNYWEQRVIRVDVALTVSHDASLRRAKEILLGVVRTNPNVLQTPKAPEVLLKEVDGLGRELIMRAWVRNTDFIPVPFALREEGTLALEDGGIALARWPASSWAPAHQGSEGLLPKLLGRRPPAAPAPGKAAEDGAEAGFVGFV